MPRGKERFELFYRAGWAYLVVPEPAEGRPPVYPEEIESRMKLLGIPRVPYKRLNEIIEKASGLPEALTEWPEGRHLASRISVDIPEDEMTAWVVVRAPRKGAAAPSRDDILEALRDHGVAFGIDRGEIERLLEEHEYEKAVAVAQGKPPVHGKGRRVEYHFNRNRGKPYLKMDFDRINLKELNFIENKEEGDLLAELLPPVRAENGTTVTGRTIAAETAKADETIPAGRNTYLTGDGTRLYAECTGNARISDGRIIVEPVVTVRNVSYETGNIHFDGSVVVEGTVADGFIVEASGNIQVGKSVGKATLDAGGHVLLKAGINGNADGVVRCGGNFFAKYVESSTVECKGHAFADEAIMRSRLVVHKHCVLGGRRAECIASDVVVGGSFWCKKLGNLYEAPTHVALGVPPGLLLEYRAARTGLETKQDELNDTEQKLDRLEKAIREGRQDERVDQAVEQLRSAAKRLTAELAELRHRLPQLREQLRASRRSMVVVEETMFKGAVVTFGTMEFRAPENGARKTILRPGETRIFESGFDYHARPKLDFEEGEGPERSP